MTTTKRVKHVETAPCYGISPVTGRQVWTRHRWNGGRCEFCGRLRAEVTRIEWGSRP